MSASFKNAYFEECILLTHFECIHKEIAFFIQSSCTKHMHIYIFQHYYHFCFHSPQMQDYGVKYQTLTDIAGIFIISLMKLN